MAVTETMNDVFDQDGSKFQWQPDFDGMPTDSTVCMQDASWLTLLYQLLSACADPSDLLGGCRQLKDWQLSRSEKQ